MASRTVVLDGGTATVIGPHPSTIERIKVRGADGKTAFEVHELRYGPTGMATRPTPIPTAQPRSRRLVAWIEQRPVAVVGALFVLVLFLSAAVTALLITRGASP